MVIGITGRERHSIGAVRKRLERLQSTVFFNRIAISPLHQFMTLSGVASTRQHHPAEAAFIQLIDDVAVAFEDLIGRDIKATHGITAHDVGPGIIEDQLGVGMCVQEVW